MIRKEQVENIVNSFMEGTDQFLIKAIVKPGDLVTVIIDGDHNISIEDCIRLSRHTEKELSLITDDFELNVLSAGADNPLLMPRQYKRYIGREIQVELPEGPAKIGKVINADDHGFELEITSKIKKETIVKNERLEYKDIKTAKPVIKFK